MAGRQFGDVDSPEGFDGVGVSSRSSSRSSSGGGGGSSRGMEVAEEDVCPIPWALIGDL